MKKGMVAICGVLCTEECSAYSAARGGVLEPLTHAYDGWVAGAPGALSGELRCEGCLGCESGIVAPCSDCQVRNCAQEKELQNCAFCEQFPCKKLRQSWKDHDFPQAQSRLEQEKLISSIQFF